jgi:ribosomal protein L11 methyltransferase
MPWLAIRLQAESDLADAVSDALIEAGALSVSCDDADAGTPDEAAQFAEPGADPPRAWRHNVLTALVAADASPETIVAAAAQSCQIPKPAYSVSTIDDQDWVRTTQRQFEPIHVEEGLWVVPSWCAPPEPQAVNIEIDPGLAFGTGSHPTTRLMLRWLARTLKPGDTLMDYGSGSGILAITAARLGAREVVGIDIDPQSLVAANDNAMKNRVAAQFFLPDAAPATRYDFVVANILANPLIVLAPLLANFCRHRIALSGILESQQADIEAAYSAQFDLDAPYREDGWILITGKRR